MTTEDRQLLIENAEDGNPEAQFQLGLAFYNGDGINKNYREAYHWFLKANEQGIYEAQHWISKMMKIHVLIDTERYPMVINRTDEQLYREAAKLLNKQLNVYRKSYPDIGIVKQWVMTAYDMAFEAVSHKESNDTKPYKDKLEELGKELDELLKNEGL